MSAWAAVMTGKGSGALATIELHGKPALRILQQLFRPAGKKPLEDRIGQIRQGTVVDNQQVLDQVTLGQEDTATWALHCHGNPLITEAIMECLARHQVKLITAAQMMTLLLPTHAVAAEARLALSQAKTLTGCRLLQAQTDPMGQGLAHAIQQWQDGLPMDILQQQCRIILEQSRRARAFLSGITVVLIGPPNSGKSTLLNTLTGRNRVLVTNISGTTRDAVEADIVLEPLYLKLIDTAGLDTGLGKPLDTAAQQRSLDALHQADLVLAVLDSSRNARQLSHLPLDGIQGKAVITLFNKSDLTPRLRRENLPATWPAPLNFCAQRPDEIPRLMDRIQDVLGLRAFDPSQPIAFTERQLQIIGRLEQAATREQIQAYLQDLASFA